MTGHVAAIQITILIYLAVNYHILSYIAVQLHLFDMYMHIYIDIDTYSHVDCQGIMKHMNLTLSDPPG